MVKCRFKICFVKYRHYLKTDYPKMNSQFKHFNQFSLALYCIFYMFVVYCTSSILFFTQTYQILIGFVRAK